MDSENDSNADALSGGSGSSGPCASPPNELAGSLLAEMRALVRELSETNIHLLVLTDQTAKCLAHIAVLLDLMLSENDDVDTESTTYLDGKPII